jgi:hypothetical protein
MADTTYQPKVYNKQGGDELIVASGGELKVESGGATSVESGGTSTIESGGRLTLEETANFKFFDLDKTGTELRSIARARSTLNVWSQASLALTSGSMDALLPAYGYHIIKDIAAAESAYMSLSACLPGDEIVVLTEGWGSNGLFTFGFSGAASLYDITRARCSSLTIAASGTNGSTFVHLQCFAEDVWSIIEINKKDSIVTANAAA